VASLETSESRGTPQIEELVWDQHVCLPIRATASVSGLARYSKAGVTFVSVNVGMDVTPWTETVKVLASFRRQVKSADDMVLARTAADVVKAKGAGKLAVSFDLEGTEPLGGELAMVEAYYDLGVRTMLIAYNFGNSAGGGCRDSDPTIGLSNYGKAIIREMNRVGMLVDASHSSLQTSLDLCRFSQAPVIFSHSNPRHQRDHYRNITDEQMRACAATGGVVGITGVNLFMFDDERIRAVSEGDEYVEAIVDGIEYVAGLIGIEHVGLGLDYAFDAEEILELVKNHPEKFGNEEERREYEAIEFTPPESLPAIAAALSARGFTDGDRAAVLGGNFLRVAGQVWR
jgi:membrane dipeptidase